MSLIQLENQPKIFYSNGYAPISEMEKKSSYKSKTYLSPRNVLFTFPNISIFHILKMLSCKYNEQTNIECHHIFRPKPNIIWILGLKLRFMLALKAEKKNVSYPYNWRFSLHFIIITVRICSPFSYYEIKQAAALPVLFLFLHAL